MQMEGLPSSQAVQTHYKRHVRQQVGICQQTVTVKLQNAMPNSWLESAISVNKKTYTMSDITVKLQEIGGVKYCKQHDKKDT